ncbi:MAG TPA: hypothetical protein VFT17_01720, partial [Propionibacteriaceae bacterium]|nr:hypothetical protein [Propionibacteriaceae bacterium]
EADQQRRAQIWCGVPWYKIPDGVTPAEALAQAARGEAPRCRSLVEDLLDRQGGVVYHPLPSTAG